MGGYNKQKVIVPICAMKGGAELQKYVDILVPSAAKLKIIHGEGPINLVGSHCVDYYGFKDEGDEESDDEEEGDTENEDMETEEEVAIKKASPAKEDAEKTEEKKTPAKEDSKKRKASSEAKSAEK